MADKKQDGAQVEVIHQLVGAAKAKLDRGLWDYVMGGAETETTILRNRYSLDSLAFRPRVLRDVRGVSTQSKVLGHELRLPVILAPVGSLQELIPGGGAVSSKAAHTFGCMHMLSSVTEPSLEDVAKSNPGPKLFQLYIRGDAAWVDERIDRVVAAGYKALALTVDLSHYGRRERDLAGGYKPPTIRGGIDRQWQEAFSWADVARIKKRCPLPIILKGIATAEDAAMSIDHGVDVVYVSNHGGRQLDHGKGTIQVLPEVVEAVRGRAPVVVDGGFVRGTDIVKAMALGASAVGMGKIQVLAGVAGGEAGIVRLLELLEDEVVRCLGLLGCKSFAELTPRHLEAITPLPGRLGLESAFPLMREGY